MTPERRELDVLAEFPHVIHPGIRGAVNLDDVHGDALGDFQTVGTFPTGGAGGTTLAVERFGQQARHRRLADPARPGKEKRVRDPLRGDGVHEHLHDMRLADHIVEHARPVFSRRNLVIHGSWRARRRLTSYLWAVPRRLYLQAMSSCAEIRGRVPRHLFMVMEIHGSLVELARHCRLAHKPGIFCRAKERSEEHTSELQSLTNLVCRLLLEK